MKETDCEKKKYKLIFGFKSKWAAGPGSEIM